MGDLSHRQADLYKLTSEGNTLISHIEPMNPNNSSPPPSLNSSDVPLGPSDALLLLGEPGPSLHPTTVSKRS